MSSRPRTDLRRTAAWRLSALPTAVFAVGTAGVFAAGYLTLAASIQRRSDTWLEGELTSLAEIATHAPEAALAQEFARELRELRSRRLAPPPHGADEREEDVNLFALIDPTGRPVMVAPPASAGAIISALDLPHFATGPPRWLAVPGLEYPIRVASRRLEDGRTLLVAQSSSADQALLEETTENLAWVWGAVTVCGFAVSWLSARRVLSRVNRVTALAAAIAGDQLDQRLPAEARQDEVARLVETFNVMLDRIQTSISQMRTVADSLAHDLRSPVTFIRGSLEVALTSSDEDQLRDSVASALEGLGQLSVVLDTSLDTSEADAGALRLHRRTLDLTSLAEELVELYLPAAQERGLALTLEARGALSVSVDEGLVRRALADLLDNALMHLPPGCRVTVTVAGDEERAAVRVTDDGPGFPAEIRERAFERSVKGPRSSGSGLGLALVRAVALAHGGNVRLSQPSGGGSTIELDIPTTHGPTRNAT
jgi:signal transduction histidine kinase